MQSNVEFTTTELLPQNSRNETSCMIGALDTSTNEQQSRNNKQPKMQAHIKTIQRKGRATNGITNESKKYQGHFDNKSSSTTELKPPFQWERSCN